MDFPEVKTQVAYKHSEALKSISRDRERTNLLRKYEQKVISYLVQKIPSGVSSDMLSIFGLFGNLVVFLSFMLATYFNRAFLLLGVLGFLINWFGDSLDGRIAYYRNIPRKHYGFSLDITIDWIGIILIGCGYIVYSTGIWELVGYSFIVMYGWEIIIALMRYRITGKYSIDSGLLGPTEVRIVVSSILIAEVLFKDSLKYSSLIVTVIMFIVNIADTKKLLSDADTMDKKEKNRN